MPAFRLPSIAIRATGRLLAVVLAMCGPAAAAAETLRVFAAGAAQGVLLRLEPELAKAAGAKLDTLFDTVGALRDRVLAGDPVDLVVLSEAGVAVLEKAGKIAGSPKADIGTISVALAVRKGAPVPDLATSASLKAALLAAKTIAHADPARGATAGTHFARVLEQLGIANELKGRITVVPFGVEGIAGVARGQFEMAVSQSSEIVADPGVVLAGPLPAPFAHRTRYVAVQPLGGKPQASAALAFLRTAGARTVFAQFGFETIP